MATQPYNTMSGRVEPLEPISPGKVGIYVCGPTVYDDPHLGHARSAVVFDVIVRYLRVRGFGVTYVRNITDIDDKIIAKARQRNQDFKALGRHYTRRYHEAMQRLNAQPPDAEPNATDYIRPIHDSILKLIQTGHAYASGGNVYFAVESFPQYGRLSRRTLQSISSYLPPGPDKRHPADFALWKKAGPEEPAWPSPWGPGRPGWHIECSAISAEHLGETFDIHGGGMDLVFPHHENEIAQSESLFGKPPANFWIHNGLVFIKGEKMSKSLGNTLNLFDLLECYAPGALRLFLLSKQYRRPIEFSLSAMREASACWDRLHRFLSSNIQLASGTSKIWPSGGELWERFCSAMDKDFNFPLALSVIFEGIRNINRTTTGSLKSMNNDFTLGFQVQVSDISFICREILGFGHGPSDSVSIKRFADKTAQIA